MSKSQIVIIENQINELLDQRERMKKEYDVLKNEFLEKKRQIEQFKNDYDEVIAKRHDLLAELAALKAEGSESNSFDEK